MYEIIGLICDADIATGFEIAQNLRRNVTIEDMKKAAEEAAEEN